MSKKAGQFDPRRGCTRSHSGKHFLLVGLGFWCRVLATSVSTLVASLAGCNNIAHVVLPTVLSCPQMFGGASSLLNLTSRDRVVANETVRNSLPHQPIAVIAATALSLEGFDAESFDDEMLMMCVHG